MLVLLDSRLCSKRCENNCRPGYKNNNLTNGLEIPTAAIFTPFNVVRVESYEENIGGKRVSHTSNDIIVNDIPDISVLVDDVNDDMPPGILSTNVVPICHI